MSYIIDKDAWGDETIWLTEPLIAVLSRSDLPQSAEHLWPVIVEAVTAA